MMIVYMRFKLEVYNNMRYVVVVVNNYYCHNHHHHHYRITYNLYKPCDQLTHTLTHIFHSILYFNIQIVKEFLPPSPFLSPYYYYYYDYHLHLTILNIIIKKGKSNINININCIIYIILFLSLLNCLFV